MSQVSAANSQLRRKLSRKITKQYLLDRCRPDLNTGCWIWLRAKNGAGYGKISVRIGKQEVERLYSHREAYRLWKGPLKRGLNVTHSCDNPPCLNPEHLFNESQSKNLFDCVARGRHPQKNKKHCIHGHKYTKENTLMDKHGWRSCRSCRTEFWKTYRK